MGAPFSEASLPHLVGASAPLARGESRGVSYRVSGVLSRRSQYDGRGRYCQYP